MFIHARLRMLLVACALTAGLLYPPLLWAESVEPVPEETAEPKEETTNNDDGPPSSDTAKSEPDKKDDEKKPAEKKDEEKKPEDATANNKTEPTKKVEPVKTETPDPKNTVKKGATTPKTPEKTTTTPPEEKKKGALLSPLRPRLVSAFTFGSYARVRAATDLEGGNARQVNVVSHGSRIDEGNYAELEFQQLFTLEDSPLDKFYTQAVATLALGDGLFHFTGDFDQSVALRNLYGDAGWKSDKLTLSFWAGSRMYRGDDIYLLDFWPLDNLNTVGGGAAAAYDWSFGRSEIKLHGGASQLLNPYQLQRVDVPGIDFGAESIVFLNRQRTITTARVAQDIWLSKGAEGNPTSGVKVVLYGENHQLPEGERRLPDGLTKELLPAEQGSKIGAELGAWVGDGFFAKSFVNLFFVQANDLAAYGEFGIPSGLNVNETSQGASSFMTALSANLETPYVGALFGSYYKYFQDADRESVDFDDYWEAIFATRIHGYIGKHIQPGLEFSYQIRQPQGPFQRTDRYEAPAVTKISFIQALSLDKGMYTRPQLRFIVSRAFLNQSALELYNEDDPRRSTRNGRDPQTQDYVGVMVEWWFNNASLFRP